MHYLKKLEINYLKTEPYYVFEVENFLSEEKYNFLYNNFPIVNLDNEDSEKLKKNNFKFSFNSGLVEYSSLLKQNKTMMEIERIFCNEDFIKLILKNFFFKFLRSRSNDLKYFLKLLRYKIYQNKKERTFIDKFLFSHVKTNIEFSFMKNRAKIVPHTDSRRKLISLMLYFPDPDLSEEQISFLGTSFFDSSDTNFSNKHLRRENDEIKFRKSSSKVLTLPFKKLSLFGFIKNYKSWHAVEEFNIHQNFIRKSININLYIY
jgi:hypothetical protein